MGKIKRGGGWVFKNYPTWTPQRLGIALLNTLDVFNFNVLWLQKWKEGGYRSKALETLIYRQFIFCVCLDIFSDAKLLVTQIHGFCLGALRERSHGPFGLALQQPQAAQWGPSKWLHLASKIPDIKGSTLMSTLSLQSSPRPLLWLLEWLERVDRECLSHFRPLSAQGVDLGLAPLLSGPSPQSDLVRTGWPQP